VQRLSGKVAVVTGAGTGIGRGIAVELGREGAPVAVHYNTSQAGALEAVRQIADAGGRVGDARPHCYSPSNDTRAFGWAYRL